MEEKTLKTYHLDLFLQPKLSQVDLSKYCVYIAELNSIAYSKINTIDNKAS